MDKNQTRGHHASVVVRDREGKILLVQEEKQEHYGLWNLPGGRIEWREQPSVAARRELLEETTLDLTISGPFAIYAIIGKGQSTRFLFTALVESPEIARAGDEILALRWVAPDDLPTLRDADCVGGGVLRQAIEDAMNSSNGLLYRELVLPES